MYFSQKNKNTLYVQFQYIIINAIPTNKKCYLRDMDLKIESN